MPSFSGKNEHYEILPTVYGRLGFFFENASEVEKDTECRGLPVETIKSLCADYWSSADDYMTKFVLTISQVADKYNINKNYITGIAKRYSYLYHTRLCTNNCGNVVTKLIANRSDRLERYSIPCKDCCESAAQQKVNEQKKLKDEQYAKQTEILKTLAPKAYEKAVYLSLKPIALRVLIELASLNDGETAHHAFKKVGISEKKGMDIFHYLLNSFLIVQLPDGFAFPTGAKEKIQQLKLDVKLKPVLGTMEKEIFRLLKVKYANIFPHQLLRTFIPEHIAKDSLESFPDINFYSSYLNMEVDFLVCDDEYRPLRAIEYQGGYHLEAKQARKDSFKEIVCNAAGVPLTAFDTSSLWKNEELCAVKGAQ